MVKRYFCDFCCKSFQDTPSSRRRHMRGVSHQRNRRMHYDSVAAEALARAPTGPSPLASAEELLLEWQATHPQTVRRAHALQAKKEARLGGETTPPRPSPSVGAAVVPLAPELEPFRGVLPPSLCPSAPQDPRFRGCISFGSAEWG